MSEFGNETATATMRFGEKTIEALLKLLKFIMERNDRKLNREMKAEQIRQMKANNKESATEYLNRKRGYVRAKKLFKSGEKLIPIATKMSPTEVSRFNSLAKMSGVAFTAISDQRIMNEIKAVKKELKALNRIEQGWYSHDIEGNLHHVQGKPLTEEQLKRREELSNKLEILNKKRQDKIIIIRAKDLELVKEITDRMNTEIQFDDIDKELSDLMSKGEENLTQEEKARVEELLKEKESMLKNEFNNFNEKNDDIVYQSAVDKPLWEEMSFEKAVNRVTDRKYANEPCYICERTNPDNYMEVTSMQQEHDGRMFTNTEFKVFNNGIEQRCDEFSHGKFTRYSRKDGENSTSYGDEHWQNMKNEIKEKGGFSDDLLIFSSKKDYIKFKEEFKKTQEKVTPREDTVSYEADANSYKDYMGVINQLKGQLAEHNLAVNEQREVYKADTKEVVHLDKNMSDDEKISYAEAINISKQIDTYRQLNECQTQLAFIRQQQEVNEESFEKQGKPESLKEMHDKMRENLHKQAYDTNMTLASLEVKANKLQMEREQLLSIKIVDMVQEQHNEEELLNNANRQHDSNDMDFQNEMNNEKSTHREEMHTQSKERWSKEVQKQGNTRTIANTEKVSVKTAEAERG